MHEYGDALLTTLKKKCFCSLMQRTHQEILLLLSVLPMHVWQQAI